MTRWIRLVLLVGLVMGLALFAVPSKVTRADEPLCFSAPGINDCISGGFRAFWENAGGLRQFGYPLTGEFQEATPDGTFTVQYFERARFEYHPESPADYQVLLGRLGSDVYGPPFQFPDTPDSDCRFFETTRFNVCEPFLSAWNLAGDAPGRSSMELYGLPITPILSDRDTEGNPISVQWFERARFELHGSNLVLFGLLGREIRSRTEGPDTPPVNQPSEPEPTPVAPQPPEALPGQPPLENAPVNVPFPDRPCHVNVPAPAEGLQVWVTLPNVSPPEDEVVCIRLIVNGEVAHPAFAQVFLYNPSGIIPSVVHTTGLDGSASFIFYVGDLRPNTTVPVEAVVTFGGREYRGWTSFVRR